MMRCGKRLLALMLTVGMVLSCISPAVSATAVEPEGHTHDNPVLLSAEDPSYVSGTACYVQYDLNNDGVLSGKDAVELLGRATQPDVYQGEQIDVDEDGDCDTQDAIALLKIALWPEKYGHAGKVHAFSGEPVWQWSADGKAAVAVFRCACGQETSEITALVARNVGKEATCTEAGFVSATASVTFLGTTYSNNKVTEIPATGHTFDAEADCTTSAACTKCDYVMPASGHNYVKTAEQAADCTHEASETYTCSVCHNSYTVKTGEPVHSYAYDREELKDGETCIFEQVLKCSQCGAEIPGETVEHHAYKASVTQEPTCQTAGVKTYTCTKCGDSYTESIPATADGHNWQDKGSGNYECANCGATKTVVVAEDNKVAAGDLENGGEVQLSGDVSVTLDEATAGNLTGELTLNVSKLSEAEKEAVDMDAEYKENSTIYGLTMRDENGSVTEFAGEVTVKLPYELQAGDDVDCITVLYVDGEGNVNEINGHYSNGYVIFTTTHFSFYTVTRLTTTQRCELYGHNDKTTNVEATCENGGYTVKYCRRCGRVEKSNLVDALGHDYRITESQATCTAAGSMIKKCSRCDSSVTETYPALGHSWSVETVEATCTAPGSETKTCETCGEKQTTVLPQKAHEIKSVVVEPTCAKQGYTTHTCANCDYEVVDNITATLSHKYVDTWNWDKSNYSAKVTLTCAVCEDTVTAEAAVTEIVNPATCGAAGSEVFEASYSYAGQIFTDSVSEELGALDHDFGPWENKGGKHERVCANCGTKETAYHAWDQGEMIKEPTCSQEGLRVYTCLECGAQENEVVAVTGEHNLVNGVCIDCGFRVDECTHENLRLIEQEIRCGNCVHTLSYLLCECGQIIEIYDLSADSAEMEMQDSTIIQQDANTLVGGLIRVCPDCGIRETNRVVFTAVEGEDCVGTTRIECTVTGDGIEQIDLVCDQSGVAHPYTRLVEQHDLAKYGFCGGIASVVSCACGQEQTVDITTQCKMGFRRDEETGDTIFSCPECEHSYTISHSPEGEPQNCIQKIIETARFLNEDGTVMLTLQQPMYWTEHQQPRYEFKMLGESCEDGFYVTTYCDACGAVEKDEWLRTEHEVFEDFIDVSGHNLCADTIRHYSCPCGQEQGTDLWNDCGHAFGWEYDDETGIETAVCADCGLKVTITRETLSENGCYLDVLAHYVLALPDGTELASWDETRTEGNHDFIAQSIRPLSEAGCLGQVEVTQRCTKCGFVDIWTEDGSWTDENGVAQHNTFLVERIDLGELGLCEGELEFRMCACGENQHIDDHRVGCHLEGVMGDEGMWMDRCSVCGAQWKHTQDYPETDTCYADGTKGLIITNGDGEEVYSHTWPATFEFHDDTYEFALNGDTCEDGGTVIATCRVCGDVREWQIWTGGHEWFELEYVTTPDNVCPGEIIVRGCPCGEEGWIDLNLSCSWVDMSYEPTEDGGWVETGRCSECGATYEVHGWNDVKVDGCRHTNRLIYTYKDRDGEEFFSRELTRIEQRHEFTYQVELDGNSCEDGYTVTQICKLCGERFTMRGNDHNGIRIEQEPIDLAGHGFCGGILHSTSCPCGQNQNSWVESTDSSCRWNYVEETETVNDDGSVTVVRLDRCEGCGATRTRTRVERYISGDSCDITFRETTVYRSSKGEEFTVQSTGRSERHDAERIYELLGETCEDGVEVTETCARCHQKLGNYTTYQHETQAVETIDLSDLPCGGYYECGVCPCGQVKYNDCQESCQWEDAGYDEATGMSLFTCGVCGAHKAISRQETSSQDSCYVTSEEHVILTDPDGKVVLDRVFEYAHVNHDYVLKSAEAVNGDCENGFTAVQECSRCGKTTTETGCGHRTFNRRIDLAAKGACAGAYLNVDTCACGKQSNTNSYLWNHNCSNDYEGTDWTPNPDGTVTFTATYTCRECGLRQEDTVTGARESGSCEIRGTRHKVISFNGEVLSEYDTEFWSTVHESYHYEYPEGGSCTDGITYRQVCDHCGIVWNEGTVYTHNTFITEQEIDLSQYGAQCGGILTVCRCLCGAQQDIRLEWGDYCDFDQQDCELWVTGAIEDYNRFDPEDASWEYLDSHAYDMICAVSDPEPCGFRIRVADYWVQSPDNPCLLQNVKTWRIGYDPATDTWQKEITVIGRTICDHNMTETNESTTNEQGQRVDTDTWVCADCGTTTTREHIYEDGNLIRSAIDFANELEDDDCGRYVTRIEEYILHGTHSHQTYRYWYRVTRSGEKEYDMHTWEYDFDNCTVHETYEASAGNHWEETRDCHCWDNEFFIISDSTCSQYGKNQNAECMNCGQKNFFWAYPYDHSWSYDMDAGTYRCDRCGLESAVGASGSIVMEDLTGRFGYPDDFVIGYWNQNEIPVTYYVSAVLNEAPEGVDEDQVIGGIAFTELNRETDDITAIAFNKAEVLRVAREMVEALGYTGSYDIRFTFVPQYGDTTLDYAITLTGVTA